MRGGPLGAYVTVAVLALALAGCAQPVDGRALPAATTAAPTTVPPSTDPPTTVPPTTTAPFTPLPPLPAPAPAPAPAPGAPAPAPAPAAAATPADVPALVKSVEGLYDALAVADWKKLCSYLDFGGDGPNPGAVDVCAETVARERKADTPPTPAAQRLLASITVRAEQVRLSGTSAVIPISAVFTPLDAVPVVTKDIKARLTTDGWKVDAGSLS